MSVSYLLNEKGHELPASARIPEIARPFVSIRAAELLDVVSPAQIFILLPAFDHID